VQRQLGAADPQVVAVEPIQENDAKVSSDPVMKSPPPGDRRRWATVHDPLVAKSHGQCGTPARVVDSRREHKLGTVRSPGVREAEHPAVWVCERDEETERAERALIERELPGRVSEIDLISVRGDGKRLNNNHKAAHDPTSEGPMSLL
jgi:hypothetical protein